MENSCVICGSVIPEGRQVCKQCEAEINEKYKSEDFSTIIKCTSENLNLIMDFLIESESIDGIFEEEVAALYKADCILNRFSIIRGIK